MEYHRPRANTARRVLGLQSRIHEREGNAWTTRSTAQRSMPEGRAQKDESNTASSSPLAIRHLVKMTLDQRISELKKTPRASWTAQVPRTALPVRSFRLDPGAKTYAAPG